MKLFILRKAIWEKNKLEIYEDTNFVDALKDILETFMYEAIDIAVTVMNLDS